MDRYRFNLRSQELKGATQLNGLYLGLDSDAAASGFAANLETVFSARVISADLCVPTKAPTTNSVRPHACRQTGLLKQSFATANGDLNFACSIAVGRRDASGRGATGEA